MKSGLLWCLVVVLAVATAALAWKQFHQTHLPPRSADVQSHYLDETQTKPSGAPIAVVFVHGIFGDDTTWGQGDVTLPKLLANDPNLPNQVDVFLFEYFSPYLGDANKITDLSEQLRGDLDYYGIWDHKKVIFVAHSMGGLIVRQFLVAHNDHIKQIPMMYFYAVPTSGAAVADVAQKISGNPQLKGMLPEQNSNFIDGVINDWMGSSQLKSLKTYCAFEGLETAGIMIVPESSARTLCTESADPLTANHIQIVKPKNVRDPKYLRLATAVSATLRELPDFVATRPQIVSNAPVQRTASPVEEIKPKTPSLNRPQETSSTSIVLPQQEQRPSTLPPANNVVVANRTAEPGIPTVEPQNQPRPQPAAVLSPTKITPELIKSSLRRYISTEKFDHSKTNVYWYIWLDLPIPAEEQVAAATYRFEDDFISVPIDSDVNPAKGAARFGASGCDADGKVTVTLEDKSTVSADFNLCRVRLETSASSVPR